MVWIVFSLTIKLITYFLSLRSLHLPPFIKIIFISYDIFNRFLIYIFFNFLKPIFYIVKRLLLRDIVYDNDSISSSVITTGNSFETILASCIPLNYWNFTTWTLIFISLKLMYLIRLIDTMIHNQLQ